MPVLKGTNSLVYSRTEYRYDPATRSRWADEIYTGSKAAAIGGFNSSSSGNNQVAASVEDGHGTLTISRPLTDPNEDFVPDRYEVMHEFVEKELWSIPGVIAEAALYDATVSVGEAPTYRKRAEEAAEAFDNGTGIEAATYPLWHKIVRYLKNGVTGWESEYVVLRRSRRVSRAQGNRGVDNRTTIGDSLSVYSTAQLDLPSDVLFTVPDSVAFNNSMSDAELEDYFWGWRRRPSTSVFEGIHADQTNEFIFSQWMNMRYTPATSNAAW